MDQNQEPKKRILIVEDEEFLRDLYVNYLTEEGFDVDSARDGEEALQKMTAGGYDLVLLDIVLPKRDGVQILKDLKTTPPKLPIKSILMLTNLGVEALNGDGDLLGVDGIIVKSDYTPDQLLEVIKKNLSEHE